MIIIACTYNHVMKIQTKQRIISRALTDNTKEWLFMCKVWSYREPIDTEGNKGEKLFNVKEVQTERSQCVGEGVWTQRPCEGEEEEGL